MPFTEASFENVIIELLRDHFGYEYLYGPDVARNYKQPLHLEPLRASLHDINPSVPQAAIDETVARITTFEADTSGMLPEKTDTSTFSPLFI